MKAYEILCDESKWTRGVLARDFRGVSVSATSIAATCFCVVGAVHLAYEDQEAGALVEKLHVAAMQFGHRSAGQWNDAPERTFAEVRDLLVKLDI